MTLIRFYKPFTKNGYKLANAGKGMFLSKGPQVRFIYRLFKKALLQIILQCLSYLGKSYFEPEVEGGVRLGWMVG